MYLVNGFYREVKISPTPATQGGRSLIPYDHEVGKKAKKLFDAVGAGAPVIVTYGVVNKDNITVFDIERAGQNEAAPAKPVE